MLQRGQLCASRNQLAKEWKWPPSKVERFLGRLETERMIGRETGQGRTVITITNYGKYQDLVRETGQATGQGNGQRADKHRTTKEPGKPTNHRTKSGAKAPSSRARGAPMVEGVSILIPDELWDDFREHRDTLRSPMTVRAEKAIVQKLARLQSRYGNDPAEVLEQTIRKGLRDVSELDWDGCA